MKYAFNSERMDFIGNHCMGVITEGDSYEKVCIFGGISNVVKGIQPSLNQSPTSKRERKNV